MNIALFALALAGPLLGVPAGWLHVRHCTYDRVAGAYYDTESAAYVDYSLSDRWPDDQGKDWQPSGRFLDGTPYEVRTAGDARSFTRRNLAQAFGVSEEDIAPLLARSSLPPAGSSLFELRFRRDGFVWTFHSAHCTAEQAVRVRALLTEPSLRFAVPTPAMGKRTCQAAAVSLSTYESKAETSFEEVLKSMGQPNSSWQYECGGIAVAYPLALKDSTRGYEAVFAREAQGKRLQWIEGPLGKASTAPSSSRR
jgi:hypothetical protein